MKAKITNEPLSRAERRMGIQNVLSKARPSRTGHPINYRSKRQEFPVHRIPLSTLIYNPYNGRIGSIVKSYEKQTGKKLNPEKAADVVIIEKFLWDSHPDHNERTLEDLLKNGQKEVGIVTSDGMIIDGNRRAMLLNLICKRRASGQYANVDTGHAEYFEGVILPEDADAKEINRLEAEYQMGVDAKQDYDPIEKYFKCKDLHHTYGFDTVQIATMMGESETQIKEWLAITELMEEYLEYFGVSGYYTLLRKKEDLFINLYKWIKKFEGLDSASVEWPYSKDDLYDLKEVSFLYIRAGCEGKEFRNIAQGKKNGGIFKKQSLWKKFKKGADEIRTEEETKELSAKKIITLGGDVIKNLHERDEKFQANAIDALESNMQEVLQLQGEKNLKSLPLHLIARAREAIQDVLPQIAVNKSARVLEELAELSKEVNALIEKIKKVSKSK